MTVESLNRVHIDIINTREGEPMKTTKTWVEMKRDEEGLRKQERNRERGQKETKTIREREKERKQRQIIVAKDLNINSHMNHLHGGKVPRTGFEYGF